MNRALLTSTNDGWQTPPDIVARVRTVFGGRIHLDPCTNISNPVRAEAFYWPGGAGNPSGLGISWRDNVYANPPYGRAISQWTEKASLESTYDGSCIIMLLPARVDARWWHSLWPYVHLCTFIRGRVKFDPPPGYDKATTTSTFPTAILCLYKPADWSPVAELGITVNGGAA
jgi:hypothetical protein